MSRYGTTSGRPAGSDQTLPQTWMFVKPNAPEGSPGLVAYTPYYVGQACRRGIADEAFNSANREKYNKALSARKRKKAEGNLSVLEFLEEWLIAAAIEKN